MTRRSRVCRAFAAAAHRRVEHVDAFRPEAVVDSSHESGRVGRVIDVERAGRDRSPGCRPGRASTCSISTGPGRHVATISHPVADRARATPPRRRPPRRATRPPRGERRARPRRCPARRSCPAIGRPMLPTPMNPIFTGGPVASQTVEAAGRCPRGSSSCSRRSIGSFRKRFIALGILRVAVRVIGRRHEVVVAERRDDVAHELLVALDARRTPAGGSTRTAAS